MVERIRALPVFSFAEHADPIRCCLSSNNGAPAAYFDQWMLLDAGPKILRQRHWIDRNFRSWNSSERYSRVELRIPFGGAKRLDRGGQTPAKISIRACLGCLIDERVHGFKILADFVRLVLAVAMHDVYRRHRE